MRQNRKTSNFQITFSAQNDSGYNRQYIDTDDDAALVYNPSSNTLGGQILMLIIYKQMYLEHHHKRIWCKNSNTGNPSGGSNGDIHYKI